MGRFAVSVWHTWLELAPWFLLGVSAAIVLHRYLPRSFAERRLRGAGGVPTAVALGVPLPLCSCGVLPAALGLRKHGASSGASVGFLISTPQTGVDSILVSASFLGWPFAVFKVVSAAAMGLVGGWTADALDPHPPPATPADSGPVATRPTWRESWAHGVEILDMVLPWVVLGVLISAALDVFIPRSAWLMTEQLGVFGGMVVALAVALPLYVCATGSVPIAAALVANGLPAGAALVFLMAGPATNAGTVGALAKHFGRRVAGVYVATIVIGSIGLGWAFSLVWTPAIRTGADHGHHAWWAVVSGATLLVFTLRYGLQRLRAFGATDSARKAAATGASYELEVEGMTCGGCVRKVEGALRETPGVVAAFVEREPGRAVVEGTAAPEMLVEAVRRVGFRAQPKLATTAESRPG